MGHSSSSVTQNITNNIINQSDLNILNKTVNTSVANTVVKNAQSAGGSTSQNQSTTVGNIIAEGKGSKVDLSQEDLQDSQLSVTALQQSIQSVDVGATMSAAIQAQIKNSTNDATLNKLVSAGTASMKSGFASFGGLGASSSSTVNTNVNNTQITDTNQNLSNIVDNMVKNNTTESSVKSCFSKVVQDYNTKIGNLIALAGGEINLGLSSNQTAKNMAECKQLTDQTNKITTALTTAMGLKIQDDTKNTTETESTAKSESTTVAKGLGSVIKAIGGIFGQYTRMVEIIVAVCLLVCCCSSFGIIAMMMLKKKSTSNSDDTADTSDADAADTGDADNAADASS